jgi:glycosyltransferase involved in cell wall biosynthesis
MAGRLSIQKNPLLAIEALSKIKDCDFRLEVVGDGPLGMDMKSLAEKLGISSKVVWNGWLEEEHVHKKMRESDLLLMTSHHEGLPMVAVEALWHGLAIVGTRIGGLLDVIEDRKNGFLCDPEPTAIAAALQKLGTNSELLESAKSASLNHAKRFNFETCAQAYETALIQVASI